MFTWECLHWNFGFFFFRVLNIFLKVSRKSSTWVLKGVHFISDGVELLTQKKTKNIITHEMSIYVKHLYEYGLKASLLLVEVFIVDQFPSNWIHVWKYLSSFQINDKQYEWAVVRPRANLHRWDDIAEILTSTVSDKWFSSLKLCNIREFIFADDFLIFRGKFSFGDWREWNIFCDLRHL